MKDIKKPLVLTEADKRSELWLALMTRMESRIEALRRENEGDLNEAQTANKRGRIAELRAMLALHKDQPNLD